MLFLNIFTKHLGYKIIYCILCIIMILNIKIVMKTFYVRHNTEYIVTYAYIIVYYYYIGILLIKRKGKYPFVFLKDKLLRLTTLLNGKYVVFIYYSLSSSIFIYEISFVYTYFILMLHVKSKCLIISVDI